MTFRGLARRAGPELLKRSARRAHAFGARQRLTKTRLHCEWEGGPSLRLKFGAESDNTPTVADKPIFGVSDSPYTTRQDRPHTHGHSETCSNAKSPWSRLTDTCGRCRGTMQSRPTHTVPRTASTPCTRLSAVPRTASPPHHLETHHGRRPIGAVSTVPNPRPASEHVLGRYGVTQLRAHAFFPHPPAAPWRHPDWVLCQEVARPSGPPPTH